MNYREMKKELEAAGFQFLRRAKGDHALWVKDDIRVTVPQCGTINWRLVHYIRRQMTGQLSVQIERRQKISQKQGRIAC